MDSSEHIYTLSVRRRNPRSKQSTFNLRVTLEELYNGSVRHIRITDCIKCLACKYLVLIYGRDGGKNCKRCCGSGLVKRKGFLRVNIRKGIVFEEVIRKPHEKPAHLIVNLERVEDSMFKREGNDLLMIMPVTNEEVELGFERVVKTLDGRELLITNMRGGISDTVLGEGMPILNKNIKGQLLIEYVTV